MKNSFGSLILFWLIYTATFYLYLDNAEERVEHSTLKDLLPYYYMQPVDEERLKKGLNLLKQNGVAINQSLWKSLKKNEYVSNLKVSSVDIFPAEQMKAVHITFDMGAYSVTLPFVAQDKSFLRIPRPYAYFYNVSDQIMCSKEGKTLSFSSEMALKDVLIKIFSSRSSDLRDVITAQCNMLFHFSALKERPEEVNPINPEPAESTASEWSSQLNNGVFKAKGMANNHTYLEIVCGHDQRGLDFYINGKHYDNSKNDTAFNIEINGEIEEPYELVDIWEGLRSAQTLRVITLDDSHWVTIPTQGLAEALPSLNTPQFPCGY